MLRTPLSEIAGQLVNDPKLYESLVGSVVVHGLPLEQVLPHYTSNPAAATFILGVALPVDGGYTAR